MHRSAFFGCFWSFNGLDGLDADRPPRCRRADTHAPGLYAFGGVSSAIAEARRPVQRYFSDFPVSLYRIWVGGHMIPRARKNLANGGALMTWTGIRNSRSRSTQDHAIPRFFRSAGEDFARWGIDAKSPCRPSCRHNVRPCLVLLTKKTAEWMPGRDLDSKKRR
jgi:hypothetical protein